MLNAGQLYTQASNSLNDYAYNNLLALAGQLQIAVKAYMPAAYAIAFVLLASGTMHDFLYPESKRFFATLLRSVVLVACMSGASTLVGWVQEGVDGISRLPAGVTFTINGTSYALTGGQAPSLTQLEEALQSKVQSALGRPGPSQTNAKVSGGVLGFLGQPAQAVQYFLSTAQHLAWQILFAIFLLWLVLCKIVVILMLFIQKVIVIGFTFYTPIALGERAHRSLRSKATGFFLTFFGVLTWPLGWSLVNAVTMGILKSVPAPVNQNFVTLLVAIVAAIPVFLWILIGYVVAPIYAQKIVTRGGAAIQGFVGTMMSVVGQSSASVGAAALGAPAAALRTSQNTAARDASRARRDESRAYLSSDAFADEPSTGSGRAGEEESHANSGSQRGGAGLFGVAKRIVDAGIVVAKPIAGTLAVAAPSVRRFGSAAQFIGHGAAEGAGETSGLESRAVRLVGDGGRGGAFGSGNFRGNGSSIRARSYLEDPQN